MPRIETLIEKLWDQYTAKAPASEMLFTLQMLQQEIAGSAKEMSVLGSSKISVFVPNTPDLFWIPPVPGQKATEPEPDIQYFELKVPEEELLKDEEDFLEPNAPEEILEEKAAEPTKHPVHEDPDEKQVELPITGRKIQGRFEFDVNTAHQANPLEEIPTLARQVQESSLSINDELAHRQPTPSDKKPEKITDLKKAISINDRFMFINELFREDEDMYERCLKTINNFDNYAEAEFWIKRELKTKIGWPAKNSTVEYFDSLIKRRFS